MKYPKRGRYEHAKSGYRAKNWSEYEAGVRRRGELTAWLSDEALDAWQGAALRQARWPAGAVVRNTCAVPHRVGDEQI